MIKIVELRAQNLYNPIGIQTTQPVLSWKIETDERNLKQRAYRIVAASTKAELGAGIYNCWDSGRVESVRHYGIEYEGNELCSMQRVYWSVQVWFEDGRCEEATTENFWETGLLREEDWQAKWITTQGNAAPIFAKTFSVPTEKKVRFARLYISGLGMYEAYMNGMPLAEGIFFAPGESDVRDTIYYDTYDLLPYFDKSTVPGKHTVAFLLGKGQYENYRFHRQSGRYYKVDDARTPEEVRGMFGTVKGIAQIVICYEDGSREIIGTDEHWSCTASPILENSWYGGEDYDATKEICGWNQPDAEQSGAKWQSASLVSNEELPMGSLFGREFEPVGIDWAESIRAEQITVSFVKAKEEQKTCVYLVDFGRNGAGVPELRLKNPKRGWRIVMYPAETNRFDGYEGHINQASCTQSASDHGELIYDTYIAKGAEEECWHPRFCYHGYRYLEVEVPKELKLTAENFGGYFLRAKNAKRGQFACSDSVLNQINVLTERSIESNMYFTFTDCPQIEKLGWLETPSLMFYSMSHTYDIRAWIPKLLRDMADAQYENGRIAAIAPEYFRIGGLSEDVNWNGSMILTAWQYYEAYGDSSIFSEQNYQVMNRYMQYLESVSEQDMILRGEMGEWGEMTQYGRTPTELVETTAYYQLACAMSKIAALCGDEERQRHYCELAEKIRTAFHAYALCHNQDYIYGNGTQSGYGCVLYSGIVKEELREQVVERLTETVKQSGYHLTSGEVGLKQVFHALAENGRSDIVYQMVRNDTMPSYKYFVDKGLTTLPEYWNFEELWYSMARSGNHAMMGHVKEWFTTYLAGIRRIGIAYTEVEIRPAVLRQLAWVDGSVDTVHGILRVCWQKKEGHFFMRVQIPCGIQATIYIPRNEKMQSIYCDGNQVDSERTPCGSYQCIVGCYGSGSYEFLAE
ncbi:MAG: family 78 glycoside hydrolase catalytic domain [Lachnospiraceae bacterium]|nr:family 78 glycoside hydrolase catalytic domain [Lachnospiraceae bacterium]